MDRLLQRQCCEFTQKKHGTLGVGKKVMGKYKYKDQKTIENRAQEGHAGLAGAVRSDMQEDTHHLHRPSTRSDGDKPGVGAEPLI